MSQSPVQPPTSGDFAPLRDGFDLLRLLERGAGAVAAALGLPAYRERQIAEWLLRRGVVDVERMTDLPRALRDRLVAYFGALTPLVVESRSAEGALKLLIRLHDDRTIECVGMEHEWGAAACLSTQVGCPVGCVFCASGQSGLERNLEPAEIAGQLQALRTAYPAIHHVVLMGVGEPLLNPRGLLGALTLLTGEHAFGLAERNVTVSTVGAVRGIRQLAESGFRVRLAVSLHAADPVLRGTLIPAQPDDVAAVVAEAQRYAAAVRRRVTYEYVLLRDVNDSPADAAALAALVGGRAHVNLIPANPMPGGPWRPSEPEGARRFEEVLHRYGVNVTLRRSVGRTADAGCGQLRARRAVPPSCHEE
jgi:23S rRNA (adenine2503-C2)-methyltransferase